MIQRINTWQLSITQIGLLLVFVPVSFQLCSLYVLHCILIEGRDELLKLEHEKAILCESRKTADLVRNVVMPMLATNHALEAYRPLKSFSALQKLKQSLNENDNFDSSISPEIQELAGQFDGLKRITNESERALHQYFEARESSQEKYAEQSRDLCYVFAAKFNDFVTSIVRLEQNVKIRGPKEMQELHGRFLLLLCLASLTSIFVAVFVVYLFGHSITSGVAVMMNNAYRLRGGQRLIELTSNVNEIQKVHTSLLECSRRLEDFHNQELALINSVADVSCSLESRLKFVSVGSSCERFWHYSPDELIGRSLLALLPREILASVRRQFESVANDVDSVGTVNLVLCCGDGARQEQAWSIRWNSSQKLYFAQARDVSAKRELDALNQRFVSIVSHDLRTPLSGISASVNLLEQFIAPPPSSKTHSELLSISNSVNLLATLADNVLELQKIELGALLQYEKVRAYNICVKAAEATADQAKRVGVRVIKPKDDAVLLADSHHLVLAVSNLISYGLGLCTGGSALELCILTLLPPGSPSLPPVAVLNSIEVAQSNLVEISVLLENPSTSAKQKQNSTQSGPTEKFAYQRDAGLRLAAAKAIAEAHAGEVGISYSNEGQIRLWLRVPSAALDDDLEVDLDEQL